MGDSSSAPPTLSDSTVLEISGKIVIAAVIVLFVVLFLVLLLHLSARWFWFWSSRTDEDPTIISWRRQIAGGITAAAEGRRRRQRRRGLDRSALKSLPVVPYDPKEFKEGLECAVCLCELQKGEKTRILSKCNHGFHVECIDKWFQSHSTCPICRDQVVLVLVVGHGQGVSVSDSSGSDSDTSSLSTSDDNNNNNNNNNINDNDNDNAESSDSIVQAFPTNVLFWGDDTQARSSDQEGQISSSSTSGRSGGCRSGDGMLVIEIPGDGTGEDDEPNNSPVATTRLGSLKRLLSRGKRVAPSPSPSSSSTSTNLGSSDRVRRV